MSWIVENWEMLLSGGLVIVAAVIMFIRRQETAKKWLLHAVTLAEKELGEGTGKLKLRYVYDMFIAKFRLLSLFISFDIFSAWVGTALEEMKEILQTNDKAAKFVGVKE